MSGLRTLFYSPVVLVIVFFVVLTLALSVARYGYSEEDNGDSAIPLHVEILGHGIKEPALEQDIYTARVEAGQRVELGFDIASELTHIYKREGESFKYGELLASLDTRRLEARKNELEAHMSRAIAMLDLAEASLKRVNGLRKNGNVSEQTLDEAQRQREAAQADRALVKAQLASIALELDKSKLFAPFDGVVVDRLSDVGRIVSLGLPVLLVEQSGQPEIRVNLPLAVAQNLSEGARVTLRHGAEKMTGQVERINLSLSSSRVSEIYIVPVTPADGRRALVPGEILALEIPSIATADGVWLPVSALAEYGRGLWSVYLAQPEDSDANEALLRRTVVEVERMRGEFALVKGGLSAAMRPYVVREATHRIVAGQRVQFGQMTDISRAH